MTGKIIQFGDRGRCAWAACQGPYCRLRTGWHSNPQPLDPKICHS